MQMKNINVSQLGSTIDIEKLTLNELLNFSSTTFLTVGDNNNNNNSAALLNNYQAGSSNPNGISGGVPNNAVYKPVPPPKPLSSPPSYRMPPPPTGAGLYNEQQLPPIPGATCSNYEMQTQSLRTHSSKFPIEREMVLNNEKGSTKIPLMNDSRPSSSGMRRGNGLQLLPRPHGAIAPDHPPKQMHAWNAQSQIQIDHQQQQIQQHHQQSSSSYQNNNSSTGAIPRTPARLPEDVTALADKHNGGGDPKDSKNAVSKTYHTLKDLISSKFKKDSMENADELNNVTSMSQQPQMQQQSLQFAQGQSNGQEDFRSPYSALPAHMRQIPNMNQSQNWQQPSPSQQPTPTPGSHLNQSQRSYASGQPGNGAVSAQQRAASQPQLNTPFERRGSQNNLLEQVNERRGSLANIDVTDSDDGGFNTKARRPVTMYQVQPQQHTPSPTHQLQNQSRQSPQVFQPNTNFQSTYASTLAQNYQQQQQFQHAAQYQNVKMDGNKQQQDNAAPMIPNRQDVIRTSFQRNDNGSNTPDSLNMPQQQQQQLRPPELPLKPGQLKPQQVDHLRQTPGQDVKQQPGSAASSDYDKSGNQSSNVDSGRGSAAYSSGRKGMNGGVNGGGVIHDTSPENSDSPIRVMKDNDSEWVDIVDAELRNILEPGMQSLTLRPESTISGSVSSMSPPLQANSPNEHLQQPQPRYKGTNHQSMKDKQEYGTDSYNRPTRQSGPIGPSRAGWPGSSVQKQLRGGGGHSKKQEQSLLKRHLFGLDNDIASTTTRSLDLESLLGTPWGAGQSVSDSETDTQGLRHIRSQLEGLENMYGEVLRMLGSRMPGGRNGGAGGLHESALRNSAARRRHGSLSSLPSSSVSGRPIRDRRRTEDRRKVRDMKGINKRFQRLESHVVTLARSVAHLSSEMRSQHMVTQELERMRDDLATLRAQAGRIQHLYRQNGALSGAGGANTSKGGNDDPLNLTNPKRVKKLTKFFGEDPPLMRLFLKKLGYEKYANLFETERVGMIELPYLGEERLQKLGVPLGPRLRILQEAQISLCKDTTLCIV